MCKYNLNHNKFKHEHIMMHAYFNNKFVKYCIPNHSGFTPIFLFKTSSAKTSREIKQSNSLHISHIDSEYLAREGD